MSISPSVAEVQVENVTFPPSVKPPGSAKTLFLGGAGVRGLEIQGKFIKFTAIGIYLEDNAVECLAGKWKGKSADELTESVEFFRDIVTGAFEKFIRVTMILPLTGQQYSEKVAENCVTIWKSLGLYTDAEEKALQKFIEIFKDENFPPGSSILFTISGHKSLTIGFSKDGSVPEAGTAVIENKLLANSVLQSIIGKDGVSPAAKQSLASRLSALFLPCIDMATENGKPEPVDKNDKPEIMNKNGKLDFEVEKNGKPEVVAKNGKLDFEVDKNGKLEVVDKNGKLDYEVKEKILV